MLKKYNQLFIDDIKSSGEDFDKFIENNKLIADILNKRYEDFDVLSGVWDYAPCTISCVGSDLHYKKVNPELLKIIGLKETDLVGTKLGSSSNDDKFFVWIRDFFEKNLDIDTIHIETMIKNENKSFYSIAKRTGDSALIIGMDVTELKEMQHNTIFNEKMLSLGEMSASIIHEINNPLTSIGLSIEMLKMLLSGDKIDVNQIESNIGQIEKMSELISRIIKSLKNFSRRGEQLEDEEFSLKEVVEESSLILGGKLKKHGVKIDNLVPEDISIKFNKTEIYQIITNIMNNSVDAIMDLEEKWINIGIQELKEDGIVIYIKDSGKGIPESVSRNIFNKFYSTKKIGEGTGLGLHIVKDLMEKNGGDIYLDKKAVNTTFVLKFEGGSFGR